MLQEISAPDLIKSEKRGMVPIESSPSFSNISYKINPKYQDVLSWDQLRRYIYLPANGILAEHHPLSQKGMGRRTREVGNPERAFFLTESDGYHVIGFFAIKGVMSHFPSAGESVKMYGSSSGLIGQDEATIDYSVGDLLHSEGASVGNVVGTITMLRQSYLDHFMSPEIGGDIGREYGQAMFEQGFTENTKVGADDKGEKEEKPDIPMLIRHTDPGRIYEGFFSSKEELNVSRKWLQQEFLQNGETTFAAHYDIPTSLCRHLHPDFESNNANYLHARLLVYIILRNAALMVKLGINTQLEAKDIGNLGKIHDFAPALEMKPDVSSLSYCMLTKATTADLIIEVFSSEGSILKFRDIMAILRLVQKRTGVDLALVQKQSRERRGSFIKRFKKKLGFY